MKTFEDILSILLKIFSNLYLAALVCRRMQNKTADNNDYDGWWLLAVAADDGA